MTLAGLPPTVGFVSEWFLLESLMQQFRVPGLGYRLVLALAGAAVALTAGFAGVTFVRIVGLIVLAAERMAPAPLAPRREYGWAGRVAVVVLAGCCLAIAAVTPLEQHRPDPGRSGNHGDQIRRDQRHDLGPASIRHGPTVTTPAPANRAMTSILRCAISGSAAAGQ